MRTKALLLTAALGAAGIATSMAQVYSVNAVGYINVTIGAAGAPGPGNPTGAKYTMIANQLIQAAGQSTIAALIPPSSVPAANDGLTLYKWNRTNPNPNLRGFDINALDLSGTGEWFDQNQTLQPGDAALLLNPGPAMTITFVGDVPQGTLQTPIDGGFSGLSSKVPQSGGVSTVLGLPASPTAASDDGQIVYKWCPTCNPQRYDQFVWDPNGVGGWDPSEPVINVGESFLLFRNGAGSGTWTRVFNVN